jgi:hypothetical protein
MGQECVFSIFSCNGFTDRRVNGETAVAPRKHMVHGLLFDELLFEQKARNLGAEKLFHLIGFELQQMAEGSIG